jgi:hypothetical protein
VFLAPWHEDSGEQNAAKELLQTGCLLFPEDSDARAASIPGWREIWLEKLSEALAEREAACEDLEARCEERKVA